MPKYLVLAASSHIAKVTTKMLQELGHSTYVCSRNDEKIKPDKIIELTNFESVEEAFVQAGEIDGAINFAGDLLLRPAHLTSQIQYQQIIDSSLTTAFACVRAAGKYMIKRGSVVLISSAAALKGIANHEAVAAAKAGIIGLTLSAASTYADKAIRFNAIAPGLIESPLTYNIIKHPVAKKNSENMHALGRIGQASDIARAILFLLDPQNNWITGQVLAVDGGLSSLHPKMRWS